MSTFYLTRNWYFLYHPFFQGIDKDILNVKRRNKVYTTLIIRFVPIIKFIKSIAKICNEAIKIES